MALPSPVAQLNDPALVPPSRPEQGALALTSAADLPLVSLPGAPSGGPTSALARDGLVRQSMITAQAAYLNAHTYESAAGSLVEHVIRRHSNARRP